MDSETKTQYRSVRRSFGVSTAEKLRRASERRVKHRITIMLDVDVIQHFKDVSEDADVGYQTLINSALRKELKSKRIGVR